jgi:glucosamine--fructose-6-phosphate aminotransferase (isomerizing)
MEWLSIHREGESQGDTMLTESFLYQEIHEQPQVLSRVLEAEKENIAQLASAIQERQVSHVVISARGTSDNAARYAQYLLGAINRKTVALATPSLFSIYRQPPRFSNALVLGISQSGRSPDIVAVLAEARRQGVLTAAITNCPDSDLADEAEYVVELHAGLEQSIAATKTYTSELAAIALLSASLADDAEMLSALQQVPAVAATILSMAAEIGQVAQRYRYMQHCVVVGRGYNYATAFELALKLKELTYTVVEPYSSADFLHGPLAMIDTGFPVILIAPSGVMLPQMQSFAKAVIEQGAEVIAISDNLVMLELARVPLALPQMVPEWLSPLTAIISGQLFAMHLAHTRDFDVDNPRGLRKVTRTT